MFDELQSALRAAARDKAAKTLVPHARPQLLVEVVLGHLRV
jgi:hypothetical protein